MSAPTTSTIGTGGTYNTLALWLADMPADITTGGGAGSYHANLKNQAFSSTNFTLTGVTTDASHTITIGCDTGASFRDNAGKATNPLLPSGSVGAILSSSDNYSSCLTIDVPFVTLFGLQVDSTGFHAGTIHGTSNSASCTIDSCLLRGSMSAGGTNVISLVGNTPSGSVVNSTVVNAGSGGNGISFGLGACSVSDTTIVRTANQAAAATGVDSGYGTTTLIGVAIFGYSAATGAAVGSGSDHDATDLASLGTSFPGSHNLLSQSYSSCFVNTGSTPTAADFRIPTGSPLKDAGTTISGVSADIVGTTRPQGSTPDIGAWEFASGSDTTPPVVANANVNAAGTTLTIHFTEAGSPPVLPASSVTGFALAASGGAVTLSSTAISSTTFTATTSRTIASGETLTLAYAPGNVTDSAGTPNAMASFSGTSVTNNSTQTAPLAAGTVSFDSCGPAGGSAFVKMTATDATGGTPTYTYQWKRAVDGGSFSNVSGATSKTVTDTGVSAGHAYQYELVYTDSAGTPATATSGAVEAHVYAGGPLTGGGFRRNGFGGF